MQLLSFSSISDRINNDILKTFRDANMREERRVYEVHRQVKTNQQDSLLGLLLKNTMNPLPQKLMSHKTFHAQILEHIWSPLTTF